MKITIVDTVYLMITTLAPTNPTADGSMPTREQIRRKKMKDKQWFVCTMNGEQIQQVCTPFDSFDEAVEFWKKCTIENIVILETVYG